MATRAERFRSMEQRSGAKAKARPNDAKNAAPRKSGARIKRPLSVEAEASGTTHADRPAGVPSTGRRNLSLAKKATYALEDTVGEDRPSRKSSRRGKHRVKAGALLKATQELKLNSPRARHARQK
jgi:hypothetical protein